MQQSDIMVIPVPYLSGLLNPPSFQKTSLRETVTPLFPESSQDFVRHKNLELAVFGGNIEKDEKTGSYVLLDGSLENRAALEKELGLDKSISDEKLILRAYEKWGPTFIKEILDEVVIALFDGKEQALYLYRDRLGKKSLYWFSERGFWLFSTELKSLIATGLVPQTPSLSGLSSFLYFGFIPQEMTPVKEVNKLLPGHYLRVDLKGRYVIEPYYSLSSSYETERNIDKNQALEMFDSLFNQVLSRNSSKKYFTLDLQTDASPLLGEHLAKEGSTTVLRGDRKNEDILSDLVKIVYSLEEPLGDFSILRNWDLVNAAKGYTDRIYIEAGFEEMLGSVRYEIKNELAPPSLTYRLAHLPDFVCDTILFPFCNYLKLNYKWRLLRNRDLQQVQLSYLAHLALFDARTQKKISPSLFRYFDPEVFAERFHRLSKIPGQLNPLLYLDAKTALPDSLLCQFERFSRVLGVKLETPFLDVEMLKFFASLPETLKGKDNFLFKGSNHESKQKEIERLCNNPRFREVFSLLEEGVLVEEGLVDPTWVHHQLGYPYLIPRTFSKLFAVLTLEVWYRLFIQRPIRLSNKEISLEDLLKS